MYVYIYIKARLRQYMILKKMRGSIQNSGCLHNGLNKRGYIALVIGIIYDMSSDLHVYQPIDIFFPMYPMKITEVYTHVYILLQEYR